MHEMPPPLSAAQLALRSTLPLKPAPVELGGRWVRLAPFAMERDAAALHALSNGEPIAAPGLEYGAYDADALVWRWMFGGPFATLDDFAAYMRSQLEARRRSPLHRLSGGDGAAGGAGQPHAQQPQLALD